ncbi:hypothetical protein Q1695_003786 [Nippostrongylus brasiliensis]|nr:hypothetical protein Q1695_003786 [Nippostrongylus brasiliensis]
MVRVQLLVALFAGLFSVGALSNIKCAYMEGALEKELHALFQLRGSCSVHQNETRDVTEGNQKDAIGKAYLAHRDTTRKANETCPGLYYDTGVAILNAFGKSGPLV